MDLMVKLKEFKDVLFYKQLKLFFKIELYTDKRDTMENNTLKSKSILIIDDEIHTLSGIKLTLELEGFENITTISDSRNVLPFLENNDVSMIILDLLMPFISGEEILAKITDAYPFIPIVINTSSMDIHTAIDCLTAGAFDYIMKPVQKQRLISTIYKALEYNELYQKNNMLKHALKKSEELNKIKSQLLEIISHEFRTPLNTLLGFSSLSLDMDTLPEDIRALLEPVYKSGKQLEHLIQNVMDLSMLSGNMLPMNESLTSWPDIFDKTFAEAFEKYPEKKNTISIEKNIQENIPKTVICDATCLEKVVKELILNAFKFTEQGSIAYFACFNKEENSLKWCIKDTGCGIEADKKDSIFDLFIQADMSSTRTYGGMGTGLNLAKELLKLMKGKIYLTDTAPAIAGTAICFEIPYKNNQ